MPDYQASQGDQSHAARGRSDRFTNALGIGGICLVMLFIAGGDYVEVLPGFERFVAGPVFPFIHESHDIIAPILSLYIAHRWTPRVGGDEFAAILSQTNIEQTHLTAERFSKAIHALPINFPFPVSASIGFAVYPDHGDSAESLPAYADRAMYQAKAGGRGRP